MSHNSLSLTTICGFYFPFRSLCGSSSKGTGFLHGVLSCSQPAPSPTHFPLQEGLGSFRLAKLHLDFFPSKISGEALVWSRGRSFPVPYVTGAFLVPRSLALPGCPLGLQQHLHSVAAPGSLAPSQRKRPAGHPSAGTGADTPGRPACHTDKLCSLFDFPHVRCSQIGLCPHT